jgi:hypothetical protein
MPGTNPYIVSEGASRPDKMAMAYLTVGCNSVFLSASILRAPVTYPILSQSSLCGCSMTGWQDERNASLWNPGVKKKPMENLQPEPERPLRRCTGGDAPNGFFNVASVGIEENSAKKPVNYVLPPGIDRTCRH